MINSASENIKSSLKEIPFEIRLLLLWILVIFLINPLGEFPINDDWAYSQNVLFLSEKGRFHFSDWPAATIIAQTVTGALFTTLTRQPGIIIPIAIGITGLMRSGMKVREIILSFLPFAIVACGFWTYQYWLDATGNIYGNYARTGDLLENLKQLNPGYIMEKTGVILMYAGLFLLPLSVRMIPSIVIPSTRIKRIITVFVLLIVSVFIFMGFDKFPVPNVFYNLGLGPKLLKDTYWGDNLSPMLSPAAWTVIKSSAVAAAYLLVLVLYCRNQKLPEMIRGIQTDVGKAIIFTILLMCSGYLVYMVVNRFFFDRYMLSIVVLMATVMAAIYKSPARRWAWISYGLLGFYMLFSISAVHDFMEWNRARWKGLETLLNEEGVSERRIDGGLEFNAWYGAGPYNPAVKDEKSWWFVTEDEYVLASGPIDGFHHHRSFDYWRWLFPRKDSVQILWHEIEGMIPYNTYPITCDCETLSENPLYLLSVNDSIRFEGGQLRSTDHARSGEYSVKLDEEHPFAFLHRFKDCMPGETFSVRIWKYTERDNIIIGAGGNEDCHTEFSKNVIYTDVDGWNLMELVMIIPDSLPCARLGIYLWNNGGGEAWLDDLEIIRIPPSETMSNVSTSTSPGN